MLVLQLFVDSPHLDIMRSYCSGSANTTRKSGKTASHKASSAQNKPSTFNGDNLDSGDFSAEQMALYKVMHSQLAAKRKAATVAEDEGVSILILEGCFIHSQFFSHLEEELKPNGWGGSKWQ